MRQFSKQSYLIYHSFIKQNTGQYDLSEVCNQTQNTLTKRMQLIKNKKSMFPKDSLVLSLDQMVKKKCYSRTTSESSQPEQPSTEESPKFPENPENFSYYENNTNQTSYQIYKESGPLPITQYQPKQHHHYIAINQPNSTISTSLPFPMHILRPKAELAIIEEQNTIKESVDVERSSFGIDCTPLLLQSEDNTKRISRLHAEVHQINGFHQTFNKKSSIPLKEAKSSRQQHQKTGYKKQIKSQFPKKSLKIHSLAIQKLSTSLTLRSPREELFVHKSISPRQKQQKLKQVTLKQSQQSNHPKILTLTPRQSAVTQRFLSPRSSKKGLNLLSSDRKLLTSGQRKHTNQQSPNRRMVRSPKYLKLDSPRLDTSKSAAVSPHKEKGRSSKKIQVQSQISEYNLHTPNKRS